MSTSNDYTVTLSVTSLAAIQVALEAQERVAKKAVDYLVSMGVEPEHEVRVVCQQHLDNVRNALDQLGEVEPA